MHILQIILFTCIISSLSAQTKNDTIFYTSNWTRTTLKKVMSIYGIKDYDSTGRGMATYYHKNGTLHSHQNELKDLKEGWCIWYHSNGKKSAEGNYNNDLPNGEFSYYTESGKLEYIRTFRNDTLIKRVQYDLETGEIIKSKDNIQELPDTDAEYPGGAVALQQWIASNVQYPEVSIQMNEQGRVYLSFVIEEDGSISNISVVKGVTEALDTEAKRLVSEMPNWIPAQNEGETCRARVQIPINFTLTNSRKKSKRG